MRDLLAASRPPRPRPRAEGARFLAGAGRLAAAARMAAAALALAALVAASVQAAPPATAAAGAAAPLVRAVEAVSIPVSDLDRSVAFFTEVLSFEKVSEVEVAGEPVERLEGLFGVRARHARLRLGREEVVLVEYLAPQGRSIPADSRSNDRWFQHVAIVVSDMDRAYARLRERRVAHASSGPQRLPEWNPNAGGISAFYFKDPDAHVLEVIHFPPGKGDPRWQQPSDRLFLGIDHTAIAVADTEASLRFYRDVLGLSVAGASENYGTEQEHLNNVFGARLRITALRAAEGPGIEFLEYLAPVDGRPYPRDTRASDLWSWQTRLAAGGAGAEQALREARAAWISPGFVPQPGGELGFVTAGQVRDPDGHALLIVER